MSLAFWSSKRLLFSKAQNRKHCFLSAQNGQNGTELFINQQFVAMCSYLCPQKDTLQYLATEYATEVMALRSASVGRSDS